MELAHESIIIARHRLGAASSLRVPYGVRSRDLIPQTFIQDLLNRVDIVDVVERYVPLKRAGANYVACCPFHSEKTPSFTVSQAKQFYHCFGCGAHGTAIGFMIEYGGLGFVEAVKDLAQTAGMQVPEIRSERAGSKTDEGDDLYAVLLKAAQHYRRQLKTSPRAIDYLKKRGLSGEIAKVFGIGYATDSWQGLQGVFPAYESKALVAAGLVIQSDEGKRYDRFRDRIMFPIVDQRGHIIGFGGRVIDHGEPKYLNSPETALFEKGRELYGLYHARRAIREAGRVLVVEGYMDVVALAQAGIGYAVATLGTATTPVHVQKLMRQAEDIVFCFDGDDAGRRAAWRALDNSLDQLIDGKQLSFLFLPQGEDPDTYVRKLGKERFENLLKDAKPLSQFLLDELRSRTDISTVEGRARLLQDARPYVLRIKARFLSRMVRQSLAQTAGITLPELDREYGVRESKPAAISVRSSSAAVRTPARAAIELLMLRPDLSNLVDRGALARARGAASVSQDEVSLLDSVLEAYRNSPTTKIGEYFRGTPLEVAVREVEATLLSRPEAGFDDDEIKAQFLQAWDKLLLEITAAANAARRRILQEKQNLSPEEQSEYKALLQPQRSAFK